MTIKVALYHFPFVKYCMHYVTQITHQFLQLLNMRPMFGVGSFEWSTSQIQTYNLTIIGQYTNH